ncbi:hypothetical protein GCK72_015894 [Caenorhabditis remanei]|uniref:Uncharacterized protein n=1 Tax=Caenorhabditis remanei TaxID=31234 RepID=A0A6A5GW91_CAERE|nr:hypothetical protein GCK72_015894 [Caenorhabditis remanei]KAF1759427.1 hypothetical protein GCK72_015894 [Caenorhabditis remanei]
MMNSEDLSSFLQNPEVKDCFAWSLAERDRKTIARFNAKKEELETQNAELIGQLENMKMTMQELIAERDALKSSNQVQIQATKEDAKRICELQEEHYAKMLKSKNLEIETLRSKVTPDQKEINLNLQEQHSKMLIGKDLEIQTLKALLVASQEDTIRTNMKIMQQYVKDVNDKSVVIRELETRLSAAEQQTTDKLKVLQEEHVKEMKNKDLEIQTLQGKLAAGQEQHVKEHNDKDLVIKELETRLPAAELQTVDKVMELTNENNRLSLGIQKLQKEKVFAEKRLQSLGVMLQEKLREKKDVQKKKEEVVFKPTTQLHTKLHTELGKLYMKLQEAKKPQEALMAQLADKDKEIEYLMEQLEAKDSEIQNLKEMIQGGDEMNEKAVMADGQSE